MSEPSRYFFLRFQKTGGTALTQRLRAELGEETVHPRRDDDVDAVFSVDRLVERWETDRDRIRLVAAHLPLCALELLDAPFATFTIVRDPVERTLSLLRNRAQRGGPRYRGRDLTVIYEDPELQPIIRDHMVKMLSMRPDEMGAAPLMQPVVLDGAHLEAAKEHLARIDVVGFQDGLDELCRTLEARFGWALGPLPFLNKTEPRPVSEALRRRIAEDNALDVELFDHALQLRNRAPSRRPRPSPPFPTTGEDPAGKIVITGTGRAGTTLLVQILDDLGLDTGLAEGKLSPYAPTARAGLECRVDEPDAPAVVKDMTLGFRIREILEAGEVRIRHVILPDRRLDVAAASRIRAAAYGKRPFRRGALTGTMRATEQQQILARMRADILDALDDFEIPHTLLEFPRFATDAAYTHEMLAPILPEATVDDVRRALERCVRPELIHDAPLTRAERWRTRVVTAWMVLYRLPMARLRERIDPAGQEARLRAAVAAARQREAELAEAERRAGRMPTAARRGSGADHGAPSP